MTPEQLQELNDRITALEQRSLPFPLDTLNRRIVNRDIPVMKRKTGDVWTVEINDREEDWDFGGGGGSGAKSVTLIVGPASNADSAGYDYTTDGTDDDVQIQAAIDALPSTGGSVCLREGTYNLAEPVTSADNNIHIFGTGSGSILKGASGWTADSYLLELTGTNCYVDHLKFDGNKAVTELTGSCRWLSNGGTGSTTSYCEFVNSTENNGAVSAYHLTQSHITISPCGVAAIGIGASMTSCYVTTTSDAPCVDAGTGNVFDCVFSLPNSFASDVIVNGETVAGNIITLGTDFGGVAINGATHVLGNRITATTSDGGQGIAGAYCAQSNYIDFTVNETGSQGIDGDIVLGNHVYNVGLGIYCSGSHVVNNDVFNTAIDGIYAFQSNMIISGNRLQNIGLSADNTYSGIKVGNSAIRCVISGNTINGDSTNDLKYCIEETTGCNRNIITSNVAMGADTSQISTVGANTVTANNITT